MKNTTIVNLDPRYTPFGEGIFFKSFKFSDGTWFIKFDEDLLTSLSAIITFRGNDIMLLVSAVNALNNMGVEDIALSMPYALGARQDRIMTSGEVFGAKVYASIINSLNFSAVNYYDPHSDVIVALTNNAVVDNNHDFIGIVVSYLNLEDVTLISPDAGAQKKIYSLAQHLSNNYTVNIVKADKVRDVATGKISSTKVYADNLQGKPCLIVDDICDGGTTFIKLAEELRNVHKADEIYLAVSHGIFSKGVIPIFKSGISKIFTTASIDHSAIGNEIKDTEYRESLVEVSFNSTKQS